MLINIILILALFIVTVLYMNARQQLNKLQNQENLDSRKNDPKNQEFSLGLKHLNSEFNGDVPLDPLTGLPGRQAFEDRLNQAINQSRRFEKSLAVMLLDVQEFKFINEKYGYEIGDKLLREVGTRLQGVVRQIDTITRYAGNTFIVMLPQLAMPETAAYVAQRLLDVMVQPFMIEDKELYLTASVGVSIFPVDGKDMKSLLANADNALHQAKKAGKNRYQFFHQELHALGQRELRIHAFMCGTDVLDHLEINYQPQVNVTQMEIVNIQAMAYANIPEVGKVAFKDFAKIATNCGKIIEIGEWIFKHALANFKQWKIDGFKPNNLDIPVTLKQIEDPQFIFHITQLLQEKKIDPKEIIFEIVEQNIFASTSSQEKSFAILNQLGIQIALSVSALGQFALHKVTKLPIQYLKLESKLLDTLNENEPIIHMIVALSNEMKIQIIADEIDNPKQKHLFQELGCEIMQGKLFGEPLPESSMIKKIEQ